MQPGDTTDRSSSPTPSNGGSDFPPVQMPPAFAASSSSGRTDADASPDKEEEDASDALHKALEEDDDNDKPRNSNRKGDRNAVRVALHTIRGCADLP